MKKLCLVLLALMVVLAGSVANAAIRNTYHDLSSSNANTTITGQITASNVNDICGFCHFPHNAATNLPVVPLWNHNTTAGTGYTFYSTAVSSTYNGGVVAALTDVSRACMSCHDASIGVGALVNNPGGVAPIMAGTHQTGGVLNGLAPGRLGKDLSNDHPISFNYLDAQTVDNELEPQDGATPLQVTGVNGITVQLFGTTKANAKLECASCHDVHGVLGVPKFLRVANTASQLCLACHIK